MYRISDQQIDHILSDISEHGIRTASIQDNLLDHICIIIEQNLEEGGNFEAFYASVITTFYKQELREIEEEANFLLDRQNRFALSKNQFFLLVSAIFLGPYIGYDLDWMINSPQATGLYLPQEIWAPTLVLALFPLLVIIVLFFTPERCDPLIPKRSTILLGTRPFIRIVAAEN